LADTGKLIIKLRQLTAETANFGFIVNCPLLRREIMKYAYIFVKLLVA